MNKSDTSLVVALVGCGTVGGGTARLLVEDRALIRERVGVDLELRYIVDVNFDHARRLNLPESLYCRDLDQALADPEVQVVVELVGGLGFAKAVHEKALAAGKHVVTANKALLATHGRDLFALAQEKKLTVGFEASCAGGIPIIKILAEDLGANRLDALYGIVNGTCNYILTQMLEHKRSYQEALGEAQSLGYAEADPTLDVSGMDSAHKITLLAGLAFGRSFKLSEVPVSGIQDLSLFDVALAGRLGLVPKLIARAERHGSDFHLAVSVLLLPARHPLAGVSGSFNGVSVYGHALGHSLYYGRGAGASPTASAVVADLIGLALGNLQRLAAVSPAWPGRGPEAEVKADVPLGRYLRFNQSPGVSVNSLTQSLGLPVLSAQALEQEGRNAIVVLTRPVDNKTLEAALGRWKGEAPAVLGLLEERPEF